MPIAPTPPVEFNTTGFNTTIQKYPTFDNSPIKDPYIYIDPIDIPNTRPPPPLEIDRPIEPMPKPMPTIFNDRYQSGCSTKTSWQLYADETCS